MSASSRLSSADIGPRTQPGVGDHLGLHAHRVGVALEHQGRPALEREGRDAGVHHGGRGRAGQHLDAQVLDQLGRLLVVGLSFVLFLNNWLVKFIDFFR